MRYFILIGLCLCIIGEAFGQIVTVTDENQIPIADVTIFSESPYKLTSTNIDGKADISTFNTVTVIQLHAISFNTIYLSFDQIKAMNFHVVMTPTSFRMDEIVVSATKSVQNKDRSFQQFHSVSKQDIALQNPQTAADLLGSSGKIFIQKSQQGGGSPMIRGFATNRLLYVVDGVRMNTAIFRAGNIQNVISLDPFATEKAEIIFGPRSVMYGSDAIGGVMSFSTLRPGFSLEDEEFITGNAVARFSSANQENTGHFDINVGWKKWAILSSFSSNSFNDLKMGRNGPGEYLRPFYVQRIDSADVVVNNNDPLVQIPSAYSQINLMQKMAFKPNEKWNITYGFHYSETSDYSRYDRHIRYKNGLPRYGEWRYGPQIWRMHNLAINHKSRSKLYNQINLVVAAQSFEESRMDRNIQSDERHIREEKVDAYSINADFLKKAGDKHQLTYGLEAVFNAVESKGLDENIAMNTVVIGPSRYPQANWTSMALYINDQIAVGKKSHLQLGARYNYYGLTADFDTTFYPFPFVKANLNNAALTGSIGWVGAPSGNFTYHLQLSSGFRSPNVDDMGKVFDSEQGSVVVPNPDLRAENVYSAEIGCTKQFAKRIKLNVVAYYSLLNNAMVRRDFQLNGIDSIHYDGAMSKVQAIQNAAKTTLYGLQAGVEIKLGYGFNLGSDINIQIGKEELDNGTVSPSRHAAPLFGVSRLNYSKGKLNFQVNCQYSAARSFEQMPEEEKGKPEIYAVDEDGNPFSPSWYTLNYKAMYHFERNFTLSAGLENITDQRYRPYSSGIVAAGRNFVLSLRLRF